MEPINNDMKKHEKCDFETSMKINQFGYFIYFVSHRVFIIILYNLAI